MRHSKLAFLLLTGLLLTSCLVGCSKSDGNQPSSTPTLVSIALSDSGISVTCDEEYKDTVFTSSDIIYYEDRDTYESGNPYGEGEQTDRHTAQEAAAHTVVNITAPGTYRLSGTMSKGQVRVDLGKDSFSDPAAVVTLILDGVDLTCEVAPAILFLNVYECDNQWSADTASSQVDTTAAGANLLLADGSKNTVNGSYVARIYEDAPGEEKLWKQDGAIYSYMSMNVGGESAGTGTLDLTAANEGLDTELHLSINGGNLNIRSQNDGINTNEDGVSVTTINGGNVHIIAGLGPEGDGIDSNGWLVINGGTVVASANPAADAGLDSDMGSYVNGGTVLALGSTMDWAESDSDQVTMNLQFASYRNSTDTIVITDPEGSVVFAYDPTQDEVLGANTRQYMGAVVSSPNFAVGGNYRVYIGGSITGTELGGVYDCSSVTNFTGGVQQAYTGTDVGRGSPGGIMRPGGGMGKHPGGMGGGRPEGQQFPQPPESKLPEGSQNPQRSEGKTPPWNAGQRPERPGGQMPEGDTPVPDENGMISTREPVSEFYMQDKVNSFSGVADL